MRQDLSRNWEILQDVHDTCEQLGLPEHEEFMTLRGPQISEWEPLPELKQLQLLYSSIRTGEENCAILMMLRGGIKKNLSCHLMRRIVWNCALQMWIITAKSG